MTPFGYQSSTPPQSTPDDSYPSSFVYDASHNLIYFTGVTYGTAFDKTTDLDLPDAVLGAMGMSMTSSTNDDQSSNNDNNSGDCFLGILKLPTPHYSNDKHSSPSSSPWWKNNTLQHPKLIYARTFGTSQNSEACSSILSLSHDAVDDALLQSPSQRKIVLLGHVNPVPLSEVELEGLRAQLSSLNNDDDVGRQLLEQDDMSAIMSVQQEQSNERSLQQSNAMNQGGLFASLSETYTQQSNDGGPLTKNGRAYGFLIDFDVSLTQDQDFMTFSSSSSSSSSPTNFNFNYAYGALLGGHVLESSPLVYPVDFTQNARDSNQLYVVSMHSDNENEVYNPEYTTSAEEEVNADLLSRPDVTLGGAGGVTGGKGLFVGGVPKFGSEFYVKVEQMTFTPSEELKNVEPTSTEHVRHTMKSGWGFGFKLNDAADVRPSCVEFVKGRTPNEDVLLMGGTTRKMTEDGSGVVEEYDGFITKIIPPSPSPVLDMTTGHTLEEAEAGLQDEGMHPTKRIDSTSGRDETVTAICLPPSDAGGMGVTHAYVVGSSTNPEGGANGPSMAYLLKMRLDDMSTVWKEHVTSISFDGDVGGDVLGQGCAVSHDGKAVYLSGTIDGASGMRTGAANADVKPIGGPSDVFVVAYDTEFGNVNWEQQLGTEYEDKLARGGGINVDSEGNPIIMGSSRGALQRTREGTGRMASDVFIMSLSRENGAYINAPFTTGKIASTIAAAGNISSKIGSVNGVTIAAIVISVIFAFLAVIVVRKRRKVKREQVSRVWQGSGDNSPSVGADEDSTSSGALRIVRGGVDDGWDDGSDRLNKGSIWSSVSGGNENNSPKRFLSSYSRKTNEDDISFLAKLREEAAASKKRLTNMISSDTTDPRVDGGASIKDMLSQYREVKKNSLMTNSLASAGKKTPDRSKPFPPPPPPRRNYEDEPDGLSEFTII